MRIVKLPGRKWVTCSVGWIVIVACFILLGCLGFALSVISTLSDGFGPVSILMAVIGLLPILSPLLVITAVSVTSTHLRRTPQHGRPAKVPLTEITHIWPVRNGQIDSSAGILVEVKVSPFAFRQKNFDNFGPELAKMVDAEWLPHAPAPYQKLATDAVVGSPKAMTLLGMKWFTYSTGWVVALASWMLVSVASFAICLMPVLVNGPDLRTILVGVLIGGLFSWMPWYAKIAVRVSSTHLWRSSALGTPIKVPLAEITQMWPAGTRTVGSPAGLLAESPSPVLSIRRKNYSDFGPQLAEMVGAEWLPDRPANHQNFAKRRRR